LVKDAKSLKERRVMNRFQRLLHSKSFQGRFAMDQTCESHLQANTSSWGKFRGLSQPLALNKAALAKKINSDRPAICPPLA